MKASATAALAGASVRGSSLVRRMTRQLAQGPIRVAMALTVVLACLVVPARFAVAQDGGLPPADEKAISSYILNKKTLDRLLAFKKEADQLESTPEDDKAIESAPKSLDDMVRVIEKDPRAAPLLKKHGLNAREYVIAYLALIRAGFADTANAVTPEQLAQGGTNAANVAFYQNNRAEADQLFESAEADDAPDDAPDTPDEPPARK